MCLVCFKWCRRPNKLSKILAVYTMTVLLVFGVSCFILWLYQQFITRNKYKQPPELPGGYPIIGHSHWLISVKPEDTWKTIYKLSDGSIKCGGVGLIRVGPFFKGYVVTDPEVSAIILNEFPDRDELYLLNEPFLGNGLFLAPSPLWKQHRKNVHPMFNTRLIESFVDIFNEMANEFSQDFYEKMENAHFDVGRLVAIYNLGTFCRTFFNLKIDDAEKLSSYIDAILKWNDLLNKKFYQSLLHIHSLLNTLGLQREFEDVLDKLNQFSSEIIEIKKAQRVKNKETIHQNYDDEEKPRQCMDILLDILDNGVVDDEFIQGEVNSLLFAGLETTTSTLTFAIILIGSYSEVQDKILAEIEELIGDSENISLEQAQNLVYLEAVLKETMRLYSFVCILPRKLTRDVHLENFTLTKGYRCVVFVPGVHRHPVWGPDASQYRPERWLEPESLPKCPAAYQAFSYGKRNCMGKNYAMLSMKIFLAQIVRNYRITADHNKVKIKFDVALRPESGYSISIERRKEKRF